MSSLKAFHQFKSKHSLKTVMSSRPHKPSCASGTSACQQGVGYHFITAEKPVERSSTSIHLCINRKTTQIVLHEST